MTQTGEAQTEVSSHVRLGPSRREEGSGKEQLGTRSKRFWFLLGCTLLAAGFAVLMWAAWQFWGTNWQAQQRHDAVATDLENGWDDGQNAVRTEFGEATAILRVPRFGEDFAIPVLEGSSEKVLAAGIGHMEDTPAGGKGNYVLAAHRVTHGEPFADLPELRPGDEVYVETREATYTYVLDTGGEDLVVPFTETWVLEDRPVNPRKDGTQPPADAGNQLITLVTCAEIFNTDDRSVVFGHLVEKTPAA